MLQSRAGRQRSGIGYLLWRRVDVVPVKLWDSDGPLVEAVDEAGVRVWALGAVPRWLWEGPRRV